MRTNIFSGISIFVAISLSGGVANTEDPAPTSFITPEFTANWGLVAIGADIALEKGYTGAGVTVGVVDSSIELTHPEFDGRAAPFQYDNVDDGSHGTHVAGIIGAAHDGVGMHGVAPDVLLSSIRIFTAAGSFISSAQVANGYDAAIAAGVRVFNNSWGRTFDTTAVSKAQAEAWWGDNELPAYRRAVEADALLIWAAGNAGFPNVEIRAGLPYYFPELESNWIAVVSVDQALERSWFSSACGVAAQWCLAAPGSGIYSTVPVDSYGNKSGTSMATPHVSGAVAIAKQMFPDATGEQLKSVVLQTATDIGDPGIDAIYGWGFLNLGNLVSTLDAETAELFPTTSWANLSVLDHVNATVRQRMNAHNDVEPGTHLYSALDEENNKTNWQKDNIWIAAIGGQSNLQPGPVSSGYDSDATGFVIGTDGMLDDDRRLGFAAGLTRGELVSKSGLNSAVIDGIHILAYGGRNEGDKFTEASAQLAFFRQSLVRGGISGSTGTSASVVGLSSNSAIGAEI